MPRKKILNMEKRRKTTDRFLCFLGSSDVVSVPHVSETVTGEHGRSGNQSTLSYVTSSNSEHDTHSVSRTVIFISGSKSR